MFDFAWSEILLIGAVALIAIGPKDMPAAIRTVTGMIKKARRMASEFQTHVDDMVREAELGDVKSAFNDLRRMDIGAALERAVDPDRSIRRTFEENPLDQLAPAATEVSTLDPVTIEAPAEVALDEGEPAEGAPDAGTEPAQALEQDHGPAAPAFIPPQFVPKPPAPASPPEAPAFIPPEAVLQRQPKA